MVSIVGDGHRIPFLCERADEGCTEPVQLTLAEYGDVRGVRARYLIVPGHVTIEGEDVLTETERYSVVEKPAA